MWQSSGADGYTMQPAQREAAGTDVIMKLKADTEDEKYSRFLEEYELRSWFGSTPIISATPSVWRSPSPAPRSRRRRRKRRTRPGVRGVHRGGYPQLYGPPVAAEQKDVTDEEYDAFYREKFFDYEKPTCHLHLSVEGGGHLSGAAVCARPGSL